MGKFWESKDFKALNAEWQTKLQDAGFQDHEDKKERLKQYDRRTIAFENRERIKEFFLELDSYITNTPDIPLEHKYILELFSCGVHVQGEQGIAKRANRSRDWVHKVISHYKKLLLERK